MTKPIRPSEIVEKRTQALPDEVIQVVNALLLIGFTLELDDVLAGCRAMGIDQKTFNEHGCINGIKTAYSLDWNVRYEKPDFNGPGTPKFIFEPKGGRGSR